MAMLYPAEQELFKEATALAQRGQNIEAYNRFVALSRAHHNDPRLLLWIAYTSPDPMEARRALDHAAWIDPANPFLPAANARWATQRESLAPPYNNQIAPLAAKPKGPSTKMVVILIGLFVIFQLAVSIGPLLLLDNIKFTRSTTFYPVSRPTATPSAYTSYTTYANPDSMRKQAAINSYAEFTASSLKPMPNLTDGKYDYYLWQTKPGVDTGTGVVLAFPKDDELSPVSGPATYYVRVYSRLANTVANDAYLYVEVLDVEEDYTD